MLTEAEAKRLTTRIQLRLGTIAENTEAVIPMIEEARNGDAHEALGYPSWTAYVAEQFGGLLPRLEKAERLPLVELMADQGMSTRAIASVVGTSHKTVVKDLQSQVVPEVPPVIWEGDDLTVMADVTDEDFETALTEARADGDVSRENVEKKITAAKKVTGMDGKSYTVPSRPVVEPSKPRRGSLPDQYRTAIWELDKAVRRLEKYHADDRFASHREAFGNHHGLLMDLADKVGLFAIQVSNDHADQVFVEMVAEGKIGGAR